jgi:hypothetical protein
VDKKAREEPIKENLMLTAHCRIAYSRKHYREVLLFEGLFLRCFLESIETGHKMQRHRSTSENAVLII